MVGDDGALVISVHSEGDWSIRLQEQKLQLYKQKLNMSDAEEFCVNLGGHLPSVWTGDEQAEISKVADHNYVWLGGRKKAGTWKWLDGSRNGIGRSGFWFEGFPMDCADCYCMMNSQHFRTLGEWTNPPCTDKYFFICATSTALKMSGNHTFTLKKENIASPNFHLWWNHTLGEASKGIAISWWIENGSLPLNDGTNEEQQWKQENHKTIDGTKIVLMVMNLVQHSRLNKVDERDLQIALLKHKEEIISNSGFGCLKESEEHDVVEKASQELGLMHDVDSWFPWISDDDMSFGMELYSMIHYCPPITVEAAKLAAFFESLLTNESLNTVVAATIHNIQPRAGDNIKDFNAINMWYERLDERYNFALASAILGLQTSESLDQLAAFDPPYLREYRDTINKQDMSVLFGKKRGKMMHPLMFLTFDFSDKDPSQVIHPPHMSSTWSSAFIPFCAFKTDLDFSKNNFSLPNITFPLLLPPPHHP